PHRHTPTHQSSNSNSPRSIILDARHRHRTRRPCNRISNRHASTTQTRHPTLRHRNRPNDFHRVPWSSNIKPHSPSIHFHLLICNPYKSIGFSTHNQSETPIINMYFKPIWVARIG